MALRNKKEVNALYMLVWEIDMNPFEKADFREALHGAFTQTINKIGLLNFKRISWFASNEQASKDIKQAA